MNVFLPNTWTSLLRSVTGGLPACLALVALLGIGAGATAVAVETDEQLRERGQAIYKSSCADCHGTEGQGEESIYEERLEGDDSVGQLADLIADTMPEGSPEECEGEDARAVAAYIHYAFYSEAARIRNRPPRVALARLTGNQLRQSLSDLYARFRGLPSGKLRPGVSAQYFDGDRWKKDKRKAERVDPVIDFDFGRESPVEGVDPKAFYIHWEGGIRADATGRYEIVVNSSCSFVMDFGAQDREFIDNHVQSGDKTEFRRSIHLTAGRIYPFAIEFIQRKRKTEIPPARITLSWKPPGQEERVIPARNLVADWVPATFALQTVLPPDDRSYGYERGIAVSPEWDASTTAAALEFAQIAYGELWPTYRREQRKQPGSDRDKMRDFLIRVVETAFRAPLSDDDRQIYIDRHLDQEPDDAEAIKRVLLVALKSPRFLYPQADRDRSRSLQVANRLALTLFDSLPNDDWILGEALAGRFKTESAVRGYAAKLVNDERVKAKTREFLYGWLNISHFGDLAKDPEQFPDFDNALVSDLKDSLDAFLDEIVWSESSDFRQLFLAKSTFTSQRIADYYGEAWQPSSEDASGASGSSELIATVEDPSHFGLLTHPYLLSGLAYHDATSPIHRGVFMIRYVLGRTLRPPADAFAPLSPDLHPDLTTRQRVELQTSPVSCQICHERINGLGFAFENYDAVGAYRTLDHEKPVDARGTYTSRTDEQVEFNGVEELARFVAGSDDAQRAFVARAFQHFVKQPPAAYGADTLEQLTKQFKDNQCNIRQLIVDIAVLAAQPDDLRTNPSLTAVSQ